MDRKKTPQGIIRLLESESVRRLRRDDVWHYALPDVLSLLGETDHPDGYWAYLLRRDAQLARLVESLDFPLPGGGVEAIDALTAEGVLRLAQSVPTPRAERVRQWLAATGRQRLDESDNPELALARVRHDYERKGHDRRWVDKRLRGISARQELTSEWARRGATDSDEYRVLTNELMRAAFGMDVESYRRSKHLIGTTANLRDHMTDLELVLTTLAETAATTLHRQHASRDFDQLLGDVHEAGRITAAARTALTARRPGQYEDPHPHKTNAA